MYQWKKVDGPHALWCSNVFQTGYYNFEDNLTLIKSLLDFCVSHRAKLHSSYFFSFPFQASQVFAPCKVIRIPEFEKLFLVESGILDFGTRNRAQGI